ncbi:MAG TPA: hypothetical protein VN461_13305 [Vicinamibacteria bacterium]|nr:hypothetical protein [Vicinamibacteria bacterium]
MSARKIGLLALILGLGAAFETTYTLRRHIDIGPAGCRVLGGKFYGKSFRFEEPSHHETPAGTRVEVVNAFGAVRLRAGTPGRVEVVLTKTVYLESEERARAFAARIVLRAEREGPVLRLFTNRNELERRDDVGFETSFDIEVPPDTPVGVRNEHGGVVVREVARAEVESSFDTLEVAQIAGPVSLKNRHGDVHVSGVKGTLDLNARFGDVELEDVEGRVTLDLQHGKASGSRLGGLHATVAHGDLSVEGVGGDLEVKGEHTGVTVSDVSGGASVQTSFEGVTLTHVGGDARVRAEHGRVKATGVKGALWAQASFGGVELVDIGGPAEVTVEHGGLQGRDLQKGARVKASGDDVDLEGFRGPLAVEADRASVHLIPQGPLVDPISASTRHGGIHLEVPAGSRFDLEARTHRGEIQVDVPGFTTTHAAAGSLTGRLAGGGSTVRLAAEGGDLSLTARVSAAQGP